MVRYQTISQLLRASFPGWSARQMKEVLGVDHSTISRWLEKDQKPTGMENCLRIAQACGVAPEEVFRIVGKEKFTRLLGHYQEGKPAQSGNPKHQELLRRFDRLIRLGWQARLEEEIGKLEAYWDFAQRPFQRLAEEHDARAAFLTMTHPHTGQVILYTYDIEPDKALEVLDQARQGWQERSHTDQGLTLALYLQTHKKLAEDTIEISLRGWTGSIQAILQ